MPHRIVSLRIPDDVLNRLDGVTAEYGGNRSQVIVHAIERWLIQEDDRRNVRRLNILAGDKVPPRAQ